MASSDLRDDPLSDELNPAELRRREQLGPAAEHIDDDEQKRHTDRELADIEDHLGDEAEEPSLYSGGGGGEPKGEGKTKVPKDNYGLARRLIKRNRNKVIAGGVGVAASLIVTFFIQIGSLFIPNLVHHIDNSRFGRLHRQWSNSTHVIMASKLALDSTSDRVYADVLDEYRDDGRGIISKINRIRPTKVAEQMLLDMEFVYGEPTRVPGTALTRQKLVGVRIDGELIDIPEGRALRDRVFHPVKYMKDLLASRKSLRLALGGGGRLTSVVSTRGRAVKLVRQQIGGVRMWRWSPAEVQESQKKGGGDPATLRDEAIRTSYDIATDHGRSRAGTSGVASDDIKEALSEAGEAEAQCIRDTSCLRQMALRGDGIAPTVDQIVANSFKPSAVKSTLSTLGVTYEIGAVMCLLYDSSIGVSKGVIKASSDGAVRTYHALAAAGDAQIYTQTHSKDPRTTAALTGGLAQQATDANNSVPERRANGLVGDTSESPSPQGSASGMFGNDTLGNFLSAAASSEFASIADIFCPALTNMWGGIAITAVELGATFIPGIGQAMRAGATTAKLAAKKIITTQLKSFFTKRNLGINIGTEVATNQASLLAQSIVMRRLGVAFNGAAVGPAFINQADAGATVLAQAVTRINAASVPMTTAAYAGTQALDLAFEREQVQQQSPFQRYLAINNPDSLVTRVGMAANYQLRLSTIASSLQSIAKLFNPFQLLASLSSIGSAKTFGADDNPVIHQEYGVTPWGWSVDEEEAYTSNPDFAPLYNQKVLQESGMEDDIVSRFGRCFTEPIEDLIIDGAITRDSGGNLIPERSLCSSYNMGDSGPDGDGQLTFRNREAEMAFRWRVQTRNDNAASELLQIQDPTDSNTNGNGVTGTGLVNADGYAWPVADQRKHGYGGIPCEQTFCHHDGTGAADLMYGTAQEMGGRAVYAISNGNVVKAGTYREVQGCYSLQLKSDIDGFYYWYGHLQNIDPNLLNATAQHPIHVNAGQQLAETATVALGPVCHGRSPDAEPAPHLHIDRGCVRNGVPQYGGSKNCRDPDFVRFMNDLWSRLQP